MLQRHTEGNGDNECEGALCSWHLWLFTAQYHAHHRCSHPTAVTPPSRLILSPRNVSPTQPGHTNVYAHQHSTALSFVRTLNALERASQTPPSINAGVACSPPVWGWFGYCYLGLGKKTAQTMRFCSLMSRRNDRVRINRKDEKSSKPSQLTPFP